MSGARRVTEFLAGMGVVCGPPFDLTFSEECDECNMKFPHLAAWITHLIAEGILKTILLEPPCATFSVMRRPPLRDRIHPFGFDTSDRQTEDGNILAHRSCQIGYVAAVNGAIAITEKPHSSKMNISQCGECCFSLPVQC